MLQKKVLFYSTLRSVYEKVSIEAKSLVRVENIRFELEILSSNLNESEILVVFELLIEIAD